MKHKTAKPLCPERNFFRQSHRYLQWEAVGLDKNMSTDGIAVGALQYLPHQALSMLCLYFTDEGLTGHGMYPRSHSRQLAESEVEFRSTSKVHYLFYFVMPPSPLKQNMWRE